MKTPEKIYLATTKEVQNLDHSFVGIAHSDPQDIVEPIEYIRTDAFIEKACKFIRKGGNRGDAYIVTEFGEEVFNFVQFAEDFKNYMKGG